MKNQNNETGKVLAIIEEVQASFNFIVLGLKTLKEQNSSISNNHVVLQLLAFGFERIIKILILLKEKHLTGEYPELQRAKDKFRSYNNGHGIETMLDVLIVYGKTNNSIQTIPMLKEDMEFIEKDKPFRDFLKIITEFSIQQRYYYIDTIVSHKPNINFNPFNQFKSFIYSFVEGVDVSQMSYEQEEKHFINGAIVCIEKGVRGISRFFTHYLDVTGRQYYNDFSNFILLDDKDLGLQKYTKKKSFPSDNYKPINVFSFLFLLIVLNAKSKTLYSHDYPDWAFTARKVNVYALKRKYFFTKIGKRVFALTGATTIRYKIPTYFASKDLKPKDYVIYLLEEAKQLDNLKI